MLRHTHRPRIEKLEDRLAPATFVVSVTDDNGGVDPAAFAGTGTLRQAIVDANANPGADAIAFAIAGTGPHTIAPLSALPDVTDAVTIDGTSEPDFAGTPVIELRGDSAGAGVSGLTLVSSGSTVRGLVINRFAAHGIRIMGSSATGNTVAGNYVGTNVTGTAALANGTAPPDAGILISSGASGNTIGGPTAAARNVISGNAGSGVEITDEGSSSNQVQGNYIGTDAAGTAAVPNAQGVAVRGGLGNAIGGSRLDGLGNLISGNRHEGVVVTASGTVIRGNLIGTDATGLVGLSNMREGYNDKPAGIFIWSVSAVTVGGTGPGEGNVISGNTQNAARGIFAVFAHGAGGSVAIQGNYIGVGVDGVTPLGNALWGVVLLSCQGVLLGGAGAARNVISANGAGVVVSQGGGHLIQNNIIGLDATGTVARGNGYIGLHVFDSPGNTVGGNTPGLGNVVSANSGPGIELGAANFSLVAGNLVGTDITGTVAFGNAFGGIRILNSASVTIGGTTPAARNFISDSDIDRAAVTFRGAGATGNVLQGNYITDVGGALNFGNTVGVMLEEGANNNIIGGTAAGAGNVITGNLGNGVTVVGAGTVGNSIVGNAIFGNGGLGIDLGDDGATPNDTGDADAGPNQIMNHPVLTGGFGGATARVVGTLDSPGNGPFRLDIYANAPADPASARQGRRYLGSVELPTDGPFDVTLAAPVAAGESIAATATDAAGNTSEFSASVVAVPSNPAVISWDGGGGNFDWNNPANWSGDQLPGAGDDVVIDLGSNDFTVAHSGGADAVRTLTCRANLHVGGGSLVVAAEARIDRDLYVNADFGGSANITVAGAFTWAGGSLLGAGSLTVAGGTALVSGGWTYLSGGFDFLNSAGALMTWTGGGNLSLGDGSLFENAGALELWTDASLLGTSASQIRNTGTLVKRGGSTAPDVVYGSIIGPNFTNSGALELRVGTLTLGYGGNINSGTITAEGGTALWLTEGSSSTGTIDADRVRIHAGPTVVTIAGSFRADATEVRSGTAAFSGAVLGLGEVTVSGTLDLTGAAVAPGATTLTSLTLNGGTLITGADLAVAGTLTWSNGTLQGINGSGSLTVLSDTTLNGAYFIRDYNLINAARMTWTGGAVNFYGYSRFTNLAGATFDDQIDGTFGGVHPDCPVFDNQGVFVKSGGEGTTHLGMQLRNSGTVRIDRGLLAIECGYVQVVNNGGSGTIDGNYTGDRSLRNEDDYVPDPRVPPLTNYTQTATGTLVQQIGGLTPGSGYGQIAVTGSVNLDGTLRVALNRGFIPQLGDQFTIIDNRGSNPIIGKFIDLPEGATVWAGAYGFTVSYAGGTGNDMTLTFTGVAQVDLTGRVFDDRSNDGQFNGADAGLGGVPMALVNAQGATFATATTGVDGRYTFSGIFPAGTYRVVAGKPAGFLDGKETAGSLGGAVDNAPDSDTIWDIILRPGDFGTGYDFAYIRPSRLQALVWEDFNNDSEVNFGERAIAGVTLSLTGIDDRGAAVNVSVATDAQGLVEFTDLRPGTYALSETQPAGHPDGLDVVGTVNGVVTGHATVNDRFDDIVLANPGSDAVNYNFGERPIPGGQASGGQAAAIGFWQNRHGQDLIKSLNGGPTSTRLGDWLAATFPNMYGAGAGSNDLTGKTNAEVATLYVTLFKRNGHTAPDGPPKLDAQVLATALSVYVTNESLAGTTAAGYGFRVTADGVGAATFSVGENGAAFGVANGMQLSVMDLLLAVNARTRNGLLYDRDGSGTISAEEKTLRTQANLVFTALNEAGAR